MIKSNGNYIAVKVPEGATSFRVEQNMLWYRDNENRGRCEENISGEIIGLAQDIKEDPKCDINLYHSIAMFLEGEFSSEWNQWLIIKKSI